ncbi:unnamed protein product [Diatraea saccharalis]|uniref:CLIP domain-containing serine protease n=1 Tax=Diatraea saccharalis TaxID=40085 RepID=A0A9P0G0I8_9NEOP|nr:unnamed protein product [Diatraea saccharalis]
MAVYDKIIILLVTLCLCVNFMKGQKIENDVESCQTVDNEVGSCITVLQCPLYMQMLQFARNNATAGQMLKRAHCGFEGTVPKVCCPRQATATTTSPKPSSNDRRESGDFVEALLEPPVCGMSNGSFGKVVGGDNATLGDFPWMALLGYRFRRGPTTLWMCGGSLVTRKHVITAAHCIFAHEEDLFLVRLGELNMERDDDGANPIDVPIKTKIQHEDYSPNSYDNDIGILVLEKEVTFTDFIKPICIPKNNKERSQTFENHTPIVAGWGLIAFEGPAAVHLQAVQVPVVSNEICAEAYTQYKVRIGEGTLCAGYKSGGRDACKGDSGGPLMQPILTENFKTAFYQIGVVGYGRRCGEPGYPGIYTRVTHFIPWIQEKLLGSVESLS